MRAAIAAAVLLVATALRAEPQSCSDSCRAESARCRDACVKASTTSEQQLACRNGCVEKDDACRCDCGDELFCEGGSKGQRGCQVLVAKRDAAGRLFALLSARK